MKPVKGWVVIEYHKSGVQVVYYKSHRHNRRSSIRDFLKQRYSNNMRWSTESWRYFYNRGYRCIRVTLRSD